MRAFSHQHATDDESLVLRVDGDVKMIVDCDREPRGGGGSFALPIKKNRPGRPRKYEENERPRRKTDEKTRTRRARFCKRTPEEHVALIFKINIKGLDTEDINYLRTMFGRYQLNDDATAKMPWHDRIPW